MNTAYCFDLDGTITLKEILPTLSYEVGLHEEISALTEATIKGVIPFRQSFLLRCRLLADISISKAQDIIRDIELNESVVDFIRAHRKNSFIITGNLDVWVAPLVEKIGCKVYSSKAEFVGDRLTRVTDVLEKSDAILDLRKEFERIIAVGDGMGDVRMFEQSDVTIAYGGVHPPIKSLIEFSNYITYRQESLCRLLNTL